jgi:hypothetical protein
MVLPLAARSAAGGGFGYRRRSPDAIAAMIALLVCAASLLALYEAGSAVASGTSHTFLALWRAQSLGQRSLGTRTRRLVQCSQSD